MGWDGMGWVVFAGMGRKGSWAGRRGGPPEGRRAGAQCRASLPPPIIPEHSPQYSPQYRPSHTHPGAPAACAAAQSGWSGSCRAWRARRSRCRCCWLPPPGSHPSPPSGCAPLHITQRRKRAEQASKKCKQVGKGCRRQGARGAGRQAGRQVQHSTRQGPAAEAALDSSNRRGKRPPAPCTCAHFRHQLAAAGIGCQVPHSDVAMLIPCRRARQTGRCENRCKRVAGCLVIQ